MDGRMDGRYCAAFFMRKLKCNRFPSAQYVVGPGSYDPKPIERSAYSSVLQPPFWSSAKRFDRKFYRLFTGNEVSERTRQ